MNIYQIGHQNTREHEMAGKRIMSLLNKLDISISIRSMFIQEAGVAYQVQSSRIWPTDLALLPDEVLKQIIVLLENELGIDVTISKQGHSLWIILQDR